MESVSIFRPFLITFPGQNRFKCWLGLPQGHIKVLEKYCNHFIFVLSCSEIKASCDVDTLCRMRGLLSFPACPTKLLTSHNGYFTRLNVDNSFIIQLFCISGLPWLEKKWLYIREKMLMHTMTCLVLTAAAELWPVIGLTVIRAVFLPLWALEMGHNAAADLAAAVRRIPCNCNFHPLFFYYFPSLPPF